MAKSEYISRVNQLDAYLLDKEILKIFQEQLNNAYKELPPGLLSKFHTEIDLLLKTLIWLNSIYRSNSTFGQQVLAITYQSDKITKNKLILHYVLTILGPYTRENCHLRLTNYVIIQKVLSWIEFSVKLFSIINFFRFLKTGKYPSLLDYVLRWNHTSKTGTQMRNVGYEYMNRELLWTGFLELLNVTLPLINYHSMKRKISVFLKPSNKNANVQVTPEMNINTKCAICSQRPSLPHHIKCQHIFCYYCLQGSVMADPSFSCPICDTSCTTGEIFPLRIKTA